jgi:hypothetical protein
MAIFHDRFPELRDEIREMMTSNNEESMEDLIRQLMDNDTKLSDHDRTTVYERYQQTGLKQAAESHLVNYLHYNNYHLPMYARPGLVEK